MRLAPVVLVLAACHQPDPVIRLLDARYTHLSSGQVETGRMRFQGERILAIMGASTNPEIAGVLTVDGRLRLDETLAVLARDWDEPYEELGDGDRTLYTLVVDGLVTGAIHDLMRGDQSELQPLSDHTVDIIGGVTGCGNAVAIPDVVPPGCVSP